MDGERTLLVQVRAESGVVRVTCGDEEIRFEHAHDALIAPHLGSVAAWVCLPIAMRLGRPLRVCAAGSATVQHNFLRLSEIWGRWLPGHFQRSTVSFDVVCSPALESRVGGDLCFYSGGIDSTHALMCRQEAGLVQTLLTIHGMDYRYADTDRFDGLLAKTQPFVDWLGSNRLTVRTNAYDVYKRHKVNPPGSDVGHAFVLAASGFLFADAFERLVLAADYRLDQQFDVHPWGTNTATNRYFDDGAFAVHTVSEDVTRAEKCAHVANCPEALASLSFCVDYSARPHNCGRCQKCVRTKAMFMAASGAVPPICVDSALQPGCLDAFDLRKKHQRAFFFDLYETARRAGHVGRVPGLESAHAHLMARAAGGQGWTERWRRWFKS